MINVAGLSANYMILHADAPRDLFRRHGALSAFDDIDSARGELAWPAYFGATTIWRVAA